MTDIFISLKKFSSDFPLSPFLTTMENEMELKTWDDRKSVLRWKKFWSKNFLPVAHIKFPPKVNLKVKF